MKKTFLFFLTLLSFHFCHAQYSIWGEVSTSYGEKLADATIFIVDSEEHATVSDFDGYYTLDKVPAGTHVLKVRYLGYESLTREVTLTEDTTLDFVMQGSIFDLDDIEISANRLDQEDPFSYLEMDKERIDFKNLAQDVPFLLEHTPSMVVTSDAGAGVGYTGMRIRGSDATRINVTINGVPLNDSESHGVFWVDLPDLGSSTDNIQIQRGVGPSSNGAGAFGGTVGLNTNHIHQNPFIKIEGSYGSFNTSKASATFTTGLMNNQYLLEGRYSLINSDGYIDRATSDLSSWFFSGLKITPSSSLRLNVFGGKEVTFQAWNGVPEVKLNGTEEELLEHYWNNSNGQYNTREDSINLFDSGRSFNAYLYPNEIDDYTQTHVQLIYNKQLTESFKYNITGHYTKGEGFFEQFRFDDDLNGILDTSQNLVVQRWLDNDFFGVILNGESELSSALTLQGGLNYNIYLGDHFGDIVNDFSDGLFVPFEYYRSDAVKTDLNGFLRADVSLTDKLQLFGDAQVRNIGYSSSGIDSDSTVFDIDTSYTFFNPKLGLTYLIDQNTSIYGSFAVANREPVRSDFLDARGVDVPDSEHLQDFELGFRKRGHQWAVDANVYFMNYLDQLVLTGAVNDVGGLVRTNVESSHRMGIELSGEFQLSDQWKWSPNVTLARSNIASFTQTVVDFETFTEINTDFEDTEISFSPNVIAGSILSYKPIYGLELNLLSKFVSRQYIDNTNSLDRSLPSYMVHDVMAKYTIESDLIQKVEFKLLVNNILNAQFSSNAYTYSYIFGQLVTENYLYPQAGTNLLLNVAVTF